MFQRPSSESDAQVRRRHAVATTRAYIVYLPVHATVPPPPSTLVKIFMR